MAIALRGRDRHRGTQLPPEIGTLKQSIADDRAAALQSRKLADRRLELLDELAEQEAKGEISREAVDAKLAEADRESAAHLRNAEARERTAEVRERDLAVLEQELATLGVEARLDELATAFWKQDEATAAAKRAITTAAKAAKTLAAARRNAAALRAEVRAELAGVDAEWPDPPVDLGLVGGGRLVAGNAPLDESCPPGTRFVAFGWGIRSHLPHTVVFHDELGQIIDSLVT